MKKGIVLILHVLFVLGNIFIMYDKILAHSYYVINVPVASIWVQPLDDNYKIPKALPVIDNDVPLHDTQLLYGERVEILEEHDDWLKIQASEQPQYDRTENAWKYCQGWVKRKYISSDKGLKPTIVVKTLWTTVYSTVKKDPKNSVIDISCGTMLAATPIDFDWWAVSLLDGNIGFVRAEDITELSVLQSMDLFTLRKRLVVQAKNFLRSPYCWGGRSAWKKDSKDVITSVDCSGLCNIVYRACGIIIPRNAHAQYVASKRLAPADLQPGDLIFLKFKKYNFERVSHVLLYIGDDFLIEATDNLAVKQVRKISAKELFGKPLMALKNGDVISSTGPCGDFEIHCGMLL